MPKEHEKIEYLPGEMSLKAAFLVYIDLECLLKTILSCQNNSENSYTKKSKILKTQTFRICMVFNMRI